MSKKNNIRDQLAILGAHPTRSNSFPPWPQFDREEEENLLQVLRSRKWERHGGSMVSKFEQRFAELCGVEKSLMVTNGSTALEIALTVAGVGAGDEVLVPPYTFMSTVMSVLLVNALPVFIDIHPDTYCIDPRQIEEHIGPNTKAIIPVHLAGMPSDMEKIMDIASKHNITVIEDACQAHLSEWNGQKVGSVGKLGCFSFQVSKNISAGEGGAIISKNPDLTDRCFYYHTCGRLRAGMWYFHPHPGTNRRMTEFQAAVLLAQIERVQDQTARRSDNAVYLSEKLSQIPGISPLSVPDFVTRHAHHLYIFRYDAEAFDGLPRDTFVKALQAEGIPCSKGYVPLYKEEFIKKTIKIRKFQNIFGSTRINQYYKYLSDLRCPVTEKASREEGVWVPQPPLLGKKEDMDTIAEAIQKIREYGRELNQIYKGK
ncbi:MAG: DegT/DnrJ/EryC1/StrS family aminotransferase [Candidatus Aerophobetes bacterium]|nr:DegT/DnrJ/EryC1/StrS family aminotransferase [Candidatus Aerophobetes bacterium]